MKIVFDIETNALVNPTKIWLIVCRELSSPNLIGKGEGSLHIFRRVSDDEEERRRFIDFSKSVKLWIGHNVISYDCPVLSSLLGLHISLSSVLDTLVISKLLNYNRDGHSIEDYGLEFGIPKIEFKDFTKYSKELEDYCVRDIDIGYRIFNKFVGDSVDRSWGITNPRWSRSIKCEQRFQTIVDDLHDNGFGFDSNKANRLRDKVCEELARLDEAIKTSFPERLEKIRAFKPTRTKHGTLNRKDFRWCEDGNLSRYSKSSLIVRYREEPFNPSSHKQLIDVLSRAGWRPTDKTKTHIEIKRQANRNDRGSSVDYNKRLSELSKYGWKINETNLGTLPAKAPAPARTLSQRILYEARRRTLTEWLSLVKENGRIHGEFWGIGSWTHRMAHTNPNTANIPNSTDTQGKIKLLGSEMRSLWIAPKGHLLVGVDAESIQLRIFAHYIDDPIFTKALVEGKKDDKTDPHSINQKILGSVCRSRDSAKRFIYALLLGAGVPKLSEILDCSEPETKQALERLLQGYEGFAKLKRSTIPNDARRGYFIGLDGRLVKIKGETEGERKHLAMSGYLQNGEAVIMKHATLLWYDKLIDKGIDFKLVDMVHDEWQTECSNDLSIALAIAECQCEALEETGRILKLKCPLKGSYGEHGKWTIGNNWKVTH